MADLEAPLLSGLRRKSTCTHSEFLDAISRPGFLPRSLSQYETEQWAAAHTPSLCQRCCRFLTWTLCVLVAALSIADRPWKKQPTFPQIHALRGVAVVVCFLIDVVPAICLAVLCSWFWAGLPGIEAEGLPLTRKMRVIMWTTWVLSCAMALDGSTSARYAAMVYIPLVVGFGTHRIWTNRVAIRIRGLLGLAIPMALKYNLQWWWADRVKLTDEAKASALQKLHDVYSQRCFDLAVEFGGIWIKEGQKLSGMPLGLPPQYEAQMKRCTNAVPPRSVEAIKECIAKAYGRPVDNVFATFDEKPLGAASIGQVHRATLADGKEVVVKVQYPEIEESLNFDLAIMTQVLRLIQGEAGAKMMNEFKRVMIQELDFMNEVRNMTRVHNSLKDTFPHVATPEPIVELCTSKVLVMTIVPGVSLQDAAMRMVQVLAKLCGMGDMNVEDMMREVMRGESPQQGQPGASAERSRLTELVMYLYSRMPESYKASAVETVFSAGRAAAKLGTVLYNSSAARFGYTPLEEAPNFDMVKLSQIIWDVFGHQVFVDGFCSADSHPGNILVDVNTGALSLIDFGNALEIPTELQVKLARVLLAITEGSDEEIAQALAQYGVRTKNMGSKNFALLAKSFFGNIVMSPELIQAMADAREEEGGDPTYEDDKGLLLVIAISLVRISSMCLGTVVTHYPALVWNELARQTLEQHGSKYPMGEHIRMDLNSKGDGADLSSIPRDQFQTARELLQ